MKNYSLPFLHGFETVDNSVLFGFLQKVTLRDESEGTGFYDVGQFFSKASANKFQLDYSKFDN